MNMALIKLLLVLDRIRITSEFKVEDDCLEGCAPEEVYTKKSTLCR
jgi:hypothetical protein